MTKRRPSNKKPTGQNASLGNSLSNERTRNRKAHQRAKYDGNEIENPAFLEKDEKKCIDSITDETSLEEFLAKAELAGTEFTAEREHYRVIEKETATVIPTRLDFKNNKELQEQYAHRLRIPRRPKRDLWETVEELTVLENEAFLQWRNDLAELQEVDGLVLTPFERNPEMWKELWRVVERSDIIVQIVDCRNPLLFRSKDLDDYVKEIDPAKQTLLLLNKADLLHPEQLKIWSDYLKSNGIPAVFWSALDELPIVLEGDEEAMEEVPPSTSTNEPLYLHTPAELIKLFKTMGHVSEDTIQRPLVVGMVGYPNVGKSSTINKLVGSKKVSVSSTPGKTRHFQTIHIDKQLCLCDCPGLVMPSFSFGRDEMFLNGILPVDQMRDHFGPTALLLTRIPPHVLESTYSIMLPDRSKPSPIDLLTCLAFMRGFMSASGIPDCSRAGRLLVKDVVQGRLRWVAATPDTDQDVFNQFIYSTDAEPSNVGKVQMEQLEKRGLLHAASVHGRRVDSQFFELSPANVHVKSSKLPSDVLSESGTVIPGECVAGSKKHFNRNKKEKIRRVYVQTY